MKRITLNVLLLLLIPLFIQGQDTAADINADNIYDLSVIQVNAEDFPKVSVSFQAKSENGKPLEALNKSDLRITENAYECEIVDLKNRSTNKPLNIGIVFDHSGSMADNPSQMPEGQYSMQKQYTAGLPIPSGYVMPIEYAKKGVLNFLNENAISEDAILFVGFSKTVDKVYPLSNDFNSIKSFINEVQPEGSTAFYDALYHSVEELSSHENQGVIVALTDGIDNSSLQHSAQEVMDYAKEKDISIYIIGLGKVNENQLEKIATSTNGFYYHTNQPEKLEEIYKNIKEQIHSIYQLDYISNREDLISGDRQVQFHFVNDDMAFSNNEHIYNLPEKTVAYLQTQNSKQSKYKWLWAGLGVLLLGIGGFFIYKNKKQKIEITKVFPNPFNEEISITINAEKEGAPLHVLVSSTAGQLLKKVPIQYTEQAIKVNLKELPKGTYKLQLNRKDKFSKALSILKK